MALQDARNAPRKVLCVAPNWLGDVVLSLPAVRALRELWPHTHLAVLCKQNLAGWLSAQPIFDEVLSYPQPRLGLRANLSFARSFGRDGFELAVLFPNSFRSALLTWVGRIPRRVGYVRDGRGLLLTQRLRRYHGPKRHHLEFYLEIPRQLGWHGSSQSERLTRPASVAQSDSAWIEDRLACAGVQRGQVLVSLAPGAAYGPAKRWWPERFADVGRRILQRWPVRLILFGGANDLAVVERLATEFGPAAINLAGHTTVGQLAAGLKRCALLLTNDSGTMHLAAAVGVPVTAIFGSTDPEWTGPLGADHRILSADVPCRPCFQRTCAIGYQCMQSITVEAVLHEVAALLNQRRAHGELESLSPSHIAPFNPPHAAGVPGTDDVCFPPRPFLPGDSRPPEGGSAAEAGR